MRCKAVLKLMSRYLDDELPPEKRAAVEAHLESCDGCRSEHEAQLRLWGLLGQVAAREPPDLLAAVERRLDSLEREPAPLFGLRLRSLALVGAAAALVGLSVWMGIWAGEARLRAEAAAHDHELSELASDVPPGFEVVTMLEQAEE
jgi:anti-sigma factor RsiW